MCCRASFITIAGLAVGCVVPSFGNSIYLQQNLVSDLSGMAPVTDSALVNPWGLVSTSASPWWVADNGTGLSTLYSGAGVKQGLVVTIPLPNGTPPAAPTGVIANTDASNTDFVASNTKSTFIFDTEDGTIVGWQGPNTPVQKVDNSGSGAVYKGLAQGTNSSGTFLFAANFNSGDIDVFNASWTQVSLAGDFTDQNLPTGYAPFDIQLINGKLYVTYALQDSAKHDDVAGPGHGFVDVFSTDGAFLQRLVSGGQLNSPWGLALAPATFGTFAGDLLVGNFGDGTIDAYDPNTGTFEGKLTDASNNPITIQGLWGLAFGNGASAGSTGTLYFTAGIPGPSPGQVEDHGLFGDIVAAPEPSVFWTISSGLALLAFGNRRILSRRTRHRTFPRNA
jgi:uncharacterized protein (TIGR03118 family)